MKLRWIAWTLCTTLAACGGESAPPSSPTGPGATASGAPAAPMKAPEAAAAAAQAVEAAGIAAELGSFLGQQIRLPLPKSTNGAGGFESAPLVLPAGCNARFDLGAGRIEVMGECELPSGRRFSGTVIVRLGSSCGPFGVHVEYHVRVTSPQMPMADVQVDGSVDVGFGAGVLHVAVRADVSAMKDGHSVVNHVAGCVIVNLPQLLFAMDATVTVDIDGARRFDFRIADLQQRFCEILPHTGTITVNGGGHMVLVKFDHDTPMTARVTVTVDGTETRVELPDYRFPGCPAPMTPPMMVDYATCGGCGNPSGGNGNGSGGAGGNAGAGGGGNAGAGGGSGGSGGGPEDPPG